MANLPILLPNSTGFNDSVFVDDGPNPNQPLHEKLTDGSDVSFIINLNGTGASILFGLSDTPLDFLSMNTVGYEIRLRLNGTRSDDTVSIAATLYDGNALTTPLTNTVIVATHADAGSTFNVKTGAFTIQGSPTKTQWDNAHLHLAWNASVSMSNDGIAIYVSEAAITGTYTQNIVTVNKVYDVDTMLSHTETASHLVTALILTPSQHIRPDGVLLRNKWTGDLGETTNLHLKVNEVSPGNDDDFLIGIV